MRSSRGRAPLRHTLGRPYARVAHGTAELEKHLDIVNQLDRAPH